MYSASGLGGSSLLLSLGPTASVTTLLCVIVVTVALVLLTLMCVCSKKTASMTLQNNSAPVGENEKRVTLKQLSKAEDIESQLAEANKEEADAGKLAESVPEESVVPSVVHLKEETRPVTHPSPHLPPRNPHNFHSHLTNQPSNSGVAVSSRASTPNSVERIHDDHGGSSQKTGHSASVKESHLPDQSWKTCRVQPDYEDMDLPDKPPSTITKADECDDTNIYQDIDLNQASKPQQTTAKTSDTIEPYAEYKEDSKKSEVQRRERKSSSLLSPESETPSGIQSTTEIPQYAKVDKSRKSHETSSNSSLANHLPEDGLVSQEVASSSEQPTTKVTEIYSEVHKPKVNAVVSNEHGEDLHVSKSHDNVNGENAKAAAADMVLNPCYGTTMIRDCPNDTTSGHTTTQRAVVQTVEEPPYSTINDERVIVAVNPEPGYSSIDEVQVVYSEISTTGPRAAAANATDANNSTDQINSPKEPIYELVDATARDETSSQRM